MLASGAMAGEGKMNDFVEFETPKEEVVEWNI
jgi:hypothetical protein